MVNVHARKHMHKTAMFVWGLHKLAPIMLTALATFSREVVKPGTMEMKTEMEMEMEIHLSFSLAVL